MPAEQVDAMVAARGRAAPVASRPAAPPARRGSGDRQTPLVALLAELAHRPEIAELRLERDGERVVWRRG
jgi:hypothetical protein